jgi:hypothetical protein
MLVLIAPEDRIQKALLQDARVIEVQQQLLPETGEASVYVWPLRTSRVRFGSIVLTIGIYAANRPIRELRRYERT